MQPQTLQDVVNAFKADQKAKLEAGAEAARQREAATQAYLDERAARIKQMADKLDAVTAPLRQYRFESLIKPEGDREWILKRVGGDGAYGYIRVGAYKSSGQPWVFWTHTTGSPVKQTNDMAEALVWAAARIGKMLANLEADAHLI